jgi:hypothetical protein
MTTASAKEEGVIHLEGITGKDEIRAIFSRFSKDKNDKRIQLLDRWILDLFHEYIKALYENSDLTVEEISAIFRSLACISNLPKEIPPEFASVFSRHVEWVFSLDDEAVQKMQKIHKSVIFEKMFVSAVMSFSNDPEIRKLSRQKKNKIALLYSLILLNILPLCGTHKDS